MEEKLQVIKATIDHKATELKQDVDSVKKQISTAIVVDDAHHYPSKAKVPAAAADDGFVDAPTLPAGMLVNEWCQLGH